MLDHEVGLYESTNSRISILAQIQDWPLCLQENLEELAMLESLDNGKPIAASRAADVPLVQAHRVQGFVTFQGLGFRLPYRIHFSCARQGVTSTSKASPSGKPGLQSSRSKQ